MRTIELIRGVHSSALGFGCAPILGSVDGNKARRAIETSLDCGINHFDLSRSYGYGQAEAFVGKIIKGRRDKVVLASKFGIEANWKAKLLRPAKPLIRIIKSSKKASQQQNGNETAKTNTIADLFHNRFCLSSAKMTRSLEKSLTALRTDHLDYFFIHEPLASITNLDELAATADILKQEGKIRGWGLAYMQTQEQFHKDYLNRFDILQSDSCFDIHVKDKNSRYNAPSIIFSPLQGGYSSMTPKEKLKKITEQHPNSVILCSMFNVTHIKENASVFK